MVGDNVEIGIYPLQKALEIAKSLDTDKDSFPGAAESSHNSNSAAAAASQRHPEDRLHEALQAHHAQSFMNNSNSAAAAATQRHPEDRMHEALEAQKLMQDFAEKAVAARAEANTWTQNESWCSSSSAASELDPGDREQAGGTRAI